MNKKLLLLAFLIVVLGSGVLAWRFLSGPEDTWLCQNGQWVKHGQPSTPEPTTPCGPAEQKVIVTSPQPNEAVSSPLLVEGQARGNWFFEASFPIFVLDANGQQIGQGIAQAQSDWMTTDFVLFKAQIEFSSSSTEKGELVLKKDNPSGPAEYDEELIIPIQFKAVEIAVVKAFFNNSGVDSEFSCNKVFPAERRVAKTSALARAALEELLKGPTNQEQGQKFFTSINQGVKIQKLTIEDGVAEVDFDEQLEFQVGGSCRVSAIRAQINETLRQFPTVKSVVISINGRTEDILQP